MEGPCQGEKTKWLHSIGETAFLQCLILTFSPLSSSQFLMAVDRMSSAPSAISPVGISPSACLSIFTVTEWMTVGTRPTRTTVVSEEPVVTARIWGKRTD